MAKQSPFYRGIYTYVAANKPDGTTVKASPRYRGIYAFDATKKPSGVALDMQRFAPVGKEGSTFMQPSGEQLEANQSSSSAPPPLPPAAQAPASNDMLSSNETEEAVSQDDEALEPAPWDSMTQHTQIDDYVDDPANNLTTPVGWSSKTIAQKKAWLDENG